MYLSKTHYPLLSTGSIQENPPDMTEKIVDWDVKYQIKQTKSVEVVFSIFCSPSYQFSKDLTFHST